MCLRTQLFEKSALSVNIIKTDLEYNIVSIPCITLQKQTICDLVTSLFNLFENVFRVSGNIFDSKLTLCNLFDILQSICVWYTI
jgi:hypothetical protein